MRPTITTNASISNIKSPEASSRTPDPGPVAPTTSADNAKADAPAAPATTDAPKVETTATADGGTGKSRSKTIISISVEPKIARQARLLAKIRGVPLSSLFVEAAAATIPAALKAALSSIRDDLEG